MINKQILDHYQSLIKMFDAQFGESCNATLYLINKKGAGAVLATKGHILSESPGDDMPEYINQYIKKNGYKDFYGFINKQQTGFLLRTSLHFIHGVRNNVIGCLCISHNMMHIRMVISFLEELYKPEKYLKEEELDERESQYNNIQDFVSTIIDNFLMETMDGKDFESLPKKEKLVLIQGLEDKGIFLVKGSVELIAKKVNLTKFAIYNYLDEIRSSAK